jgi:hypothetical protein
MRWRVLVVILVVIVAAAVLLVAARPLTLLADRVTAARVASAPATPIGWQGDVLVVGGQVLNLQAPDFSPAARLQLDAGGRLVVAAGGATFVLGPRAGVVAALGGEAPAFAAEPGDETSFTTERSWLGWPTPFDFNFMTGRSPSWRRAVYYRLVWTKRSGARLEMIWRFEQYYYDDWASPTMTREDWSGLAHVEIR